MDAWHAEADAVLTRGINAIRHDVAVYANRSSMLAYMHDCKYMAGTPSPVSIDPDINLGGGFYSNDSSY